MIELDCDLLRERAARLRRQARSILDDHARQALLELAHDYEVRAGAAEASRHLKALEVENPGM